MGNARFDVLRLFQHYGLDPDDYVDSSAIRARAAAVARSQSERMARDWDERDLFDYRNFDLAPDGGG